MVAQVIQALAQRCGTLGFPLNNLGWGGDWFRAHGEIDTVVTSYPQLRVAHVLGNK
jgi:hypothetical protein